MIARSINDIEAIEDFIAHGIPETINACVLPTAMICVLLYLNWQLALVALLPLPVASWVVFRSVSKVRTEWRPVRQRLEDLTAQVQDNLSGVTVIKSFVQEKLQAQTIENRSKRLRDDMLRASTLSFVPVGVIEVTSGVGVVLIALLGGAMALGGRVSAADLFVFIVYLTQIYQPFLQLANMNDTLQKATVSSERVFELLDLRPDIVSPPHGVRPARMTWDVELQDVTFGYQPARPVLSAVNINVAAGDYGRVGWRDWAGKTTATNLIPRFYDPQHGCVRVGDTTCGLWTSTFCAAILLWCCRMSFSSTAAYARIFSLAVRMPRRLSCTPRLGRPMQRNSSSPCPRAMTLSLGSAGSDYPQAKATPVHCTGSAQRRTNFNPG